MFRKEKTPVTNQTKKWSSSLDICLPIDSTKLESFRAWIRWNGFKPGIGPIDMMLPDQYH